MALSNTFIHAVLAEKRQRHPELRRPLDWTGLQAVCAREGISIRYGPLPADAVLIAADGSAVIVLNSELPPRRHTYRAAHELAHAWLHADREPTIYQLRDLYGPDHREDEAEYLAALMLGGPLYSRTQGNQ